MTGSPSGLPGVAAAALSPYASVVVLECTAPNPTAETARLKPTLQRLRKARAGKEVVIVADGLDREPGASDRAPSADTPYVDAYVTSISRRPGWAAADSDFTETLLELTVIAGVRRLVAVHCDAALAEALQRWLDRPPVPAWRRVPEATLQAALLGGDAKNLWLRGAHARRSTKPDSKVISGANLRDALNPLEDNSYLMGSARAEFVPDPAFASLTGVVGVTPRASRVWLRQTTDLSDFRTLVNDLLACLEAALAAGATDDNPFLYLAVETHDLTAVHGAYDLSVATVGDLQAVGGSTQDVIDAAALLESATLDVQGAPASADFDVDVGLGGSHDGRLRCAVVREPQRVALRFGYAGAPRNPGPTRQVLDALRQDGIITVHYQTGHAVADGRIWSTEPQTTAFPAWDWEDFTGYDVTAEKPRGAADPQAVHDDTGLPGDTSLFAWVVAHLGPGGYLTCDDGPNEAADFVRLGYDWRLTFVHVKASTSASARRRTNVSSYEVVVSQATKNLRYLQGTDLLTRLRSPGVGRPAVWEDGRRVADRGDMLDFLEMLPAGAVREVLVVQPQMRRQAYADGLAQAPGSVERMRVQLLDTLLNGNRSTVTGTGADLRVVGSLT